MRIGAFVLLPLIIIGVASIVFQLTSTKSGEYALFDFNIGKLWSWATAGNSEKPSETVKPIVPGEFFTKVESKTAESPIVQREVFKTQPREVNMVKLSSELTPSIDLSGFKNLDGMGAKPVNWKASLRTSRFFDPTIKEFLISPNIQIRQSRFAIGASFSPSFTYRRLNYSNISEVARVDNSTVYTYGQSKEYRKKNDKAILNFCSGLDIYIALSNRWNLQTGFCYSSQGEQLQVIKGEENLNNPPVSPSENSPFNNAKDLYFSPEMVDYQEDQKMPFSNYYGLMEVPMVLSYSAIHLNNQLSLQVQGGISYAYMDHADLLMYDYETSKYYWINKSDFQLLNRHFVNVITGVALSQYISEEIEVFANPQFKYSLTPTFKEDYELRQHQYAMGLRLGMKVHL